MLRDAFVALGLLSAPGNRPRRDKIREMSAVLSSYVDGGVALRFVLSVPASAPDRGSVLSESRDLVLLNESETPFRCGFKYVLWFAYALKAFPTAAYFAAGDDDAYFQLSHLEADLRYVHEQAAAAPTLYGLLQWRAYYDNVTLDCSTGFMGWEFFDAQAMRVRRAMEACRDEANAVATSTEHRATLLRELLAMQRARQEARESARGKKRASAAAAADQTAPPRAVVPLSGLKGKGIKALRGAINDALAAAEAET